MERLIATEKNEPYNGVLEDPMPFFHEIDYVIATWLHYRRHGAYPRAGGYDKQDSQLMQDWATMDLYHLRIERGDYKSFYVPENAPDVSTMMGG